MNLDTLRAALKPLTEFGKEELFFDVEGTTVFLRSLLPSEEIQAQRRATELLEEARKTEGLADNDAITRTTALSYFDQFRSEVVSYAIVQIGDADFRGVTHIETGEVLESGAKVKVPLHKAIHDVISKSWSRGMITIAFSKYGDLITRIAERADRVARSSVSDLDAEIERVENRLKSLRSERESRAKGDPGVTHHQILSLVKAGAQIEDEIDSTIELSRRAREAREDLEREEEEVLEEEDAIPEPPKPIREKVSPTRAPPPTAPPPPPPRVETLDSDSEETLIQKAQRAAQLSSLSGAVQQDSLGDVDHYKLPPQTIGPRDRRVATERTKYDPTPAGALNPNFKKH